MVALSFLPRGSTENGSVPGSESAPSQDTAAASVQDTPTQPRANHPAPEGIVSISGRVYALKPSSNQRETRKQTRAFCQQHGGGCHCLVFDVRCAAGGDTEGHSRSGLHSTVVKADVGFGGGRGGPMSIAPLCLEKVFSTCQAMEEWLTADPRHVVLLQCPAAPHAILSFLSALLAFAPEDQIVARGTGDVTATLDGFVLQAQRLCEALCPPSYRVTPSPYATQLASAMQRSRLRRRAASTPLHAANTARSSAAHGSAGGNPLAGRRASLPASLVPVAGGESSRWRRWSIMSGLGRPSSGFAVGRMDDATRRHVLGMEAFSTCMLQSITVNESAANMETSAPLYVEIYSTASDAPLVASRLSQVEGSVTAPNNGRVEGTPSTSPNSAGSQQSHWHLQVDKRIDGELLAFIHSSPPSRSFLTVDTSAPSSARGAPAGGRFTSLFKRSQATAPEGGSASDRSPTAHSPPLATFQLHLSDILHRPPGGAKRAATGGDSSSSSDEGEVRDGVGRVTETVRIDGLRLVKCQLTATDVVSRHQLPDDFAITLNFEVYPENVFAHVSNSPTRVSVRVPCGPPVVNPSMSPSRSDDSRGASTAAQSASSGAHDATTNTADDPTGQPQVETDEQIAWRLFLEDTSTTQPRPMPAVPLERGEPPRPPAAAAVSTTTEPPNAVGSPAASGEQSGGSGGDTGYRDVAAEGQTRAPEGSSVRDADELLARRLQQQYLLEAQRRHRGSPQLPLLLDDLFPSLSLSTGTSAAAARGTANAGPAEAAATSSVGASRNTSQSVSSSASAADATNDGSEDVPREAAGAASAAAASSVSPSGASRGAEARMSLRRQLELLNSFLDDNQRVFSSNDPPNLLGDRSENIISEIDLISSRLSLRRNRFPFTVGASHFEINALPTYTYSCKAAAKDDDECGGKGVGDDERNKCMVCQEEFDEGDKLKNLPCFHSFHAECVDKWLAVKKTCPICQLRIDRPNLPPNDTARGTSSLDPSNALRGSNIARLRLQLHQNQLVLDALSPRGDNGPEPRGENDYDEEFLRSLETMYRIPLMRRSRGVGMSLGRPTAASARRESRTRSGSTTSNHRFSFLHGWGRQRADEPLRDPVDGEEIVPIDSFGRSSRWVRRYSLPSEARRLRRRRIMG